MPAPPFGTLTQPPAISSPRVLDHLLRARLAEQLLLVDDVSQTSHRFIDSSITDTGSPVSSGPIQQAHHPASEVGAAPTGALDEQERSTAVVTPTAPMRDDQQ
jgi:hypothetical protein